MLTHWSEAESLCWFSLCEAYIWWRIFRPIKGNYDTSKQQPLPLAQVSEPGSTGSGLWNLSCRAKKSSVYIWAGAWALWLVRWRMDLRAWALVQYQTSTLLSLVPAVWARVSWPSLRLSVVFFCFVVCLVFLLRSHSLRCPTPTESQW